MYNQQTNKIRPPQVDDDVDSFMSKRQTAVPKSPPMPRAAQPDDDVDSFMSKRQAAPKAAASVASFSGTNPTAPIIERTPKGTPTYDEWRKSDSTEVPDTFRPDYSHWTNAEMPDKAGNMRSFPARELDPGPKDGAEQVDTWFDATKPYSSETMSYKPKGVAPKPRVVDPRARQAAQISRQINQQRDEATRLFKQADATPMERMGGNFSNTEALRAQAEGKLAGANELARRAQKTHGDLLEVGFGKDADPNSRREWAYAKPKAPKVMEESDALALNTGNVRRFADPNGLNQALNVTPEAKARFDHQRKIEGIQQSSYPGLDPVARFGSRVWQGINGESAADMAEAYPPVIPGEEDINRIAQSGVKGAGQLVRGGATALPYAFPVVDMMSKGLTGKPLRAYTEGLGRPMESAISRGAETVLPENPANQSFLAKTERGAGSMIPAMGGALATGGGSLAAGALGALTNLGQVADERDQSKVPISDFRRVSSDALAIATGMTEALGMGKLLNRVGLSTPLAHRLAQMIEEGGQEYAQDYLNDINAKLVAAYDPQRQINDPLAAKRLEAAAIGAILGAGGEVADYAGGKVNDRIATSAIRAESAPMQGIQPTTLGPTQITPLSRATAAAQPATTIPAIDQTVPKSTIVEPSVPPVAAESQSSAFPRLPEVEGVNSREANLFGLKSPTETRVNTALQTADKLLNSQSESDQRQGKRMLRQSLADVQKSEGYQAELGLPDDAPKPYTAVRQAIEDRLKPAPKVAEQAAPVSELPAAQPGNTGQRLIEQTRQKADDAINEGRYDDAVSELKAHQQALKDAKTAARKSPGMRTQIERQIGQVGNQIGEVRRMAREARKQANAPTAPLPKSQQNQQVPMVNNTGNVQSDANPPLLRPEAVQNPSGGIPQMPEQTFSGRLEQGIRNDAAEQAKPQQGKATADLSSIEYLKRKTNRQGFRVSDKGEARRLGSKEAGIIGLTNKKSKWSVHDAQVMLDEGGFTMPDGRAFTDESVTEHDVLTYLDDFGKEKPMNTGNLDQRLKDEEADYWAKTEGQSPRKLPEKVYHATNRDFEGLPQDMPGMLGERRRFHGEPNGVFYSESESGAKQATGYGQKQRVIEAVPSSQNPFVVSDENAQEYEDYYKRALRDIGGESAAQNPEDYLTGNPGSGVAVSQRMTELMLDDGYDAVFNTRNGDFIALTPDSATPAKREGEPTKSFGEIDAEVRGEFKPDTADLREVREFGKREAAEPEYTEEPPTAPLARMKNQPTVRDILRGKKGEFGKVSAFARQGERLAAHPELRKSLGLPEMPPYHSPDADINPRTGQPFTNPEWGKATQETMDALSDLAGIPRSSRMGIEGLWKAHDAVSRKGAVSPSLLNAFIDTAESYTKFVERVQSFFDENSTIADVINEVQSTYEQGSELTARQESQLKSAVKNAAGEYGINANYAEKTLWPAIRDTKAEYLGESRRVAPATTERNVPVEKAAVPRNAPSSQPAERVAEESQRGKESVRQPEGKASENESKPKVKEPWQMTRKEFRSTWDTPEFRKKFPNYKGEQDHDVLVEDAVESGKPVPAEVLADYPELQKKSEPAPIKTGDSVTWKRGDLVNWDARGITRSGTVKSVQNGNAVIDIGYDMTETVPVSKLAGVEVTKPSRIKADKFIADETESLRQEWGILRTFGEDNMEGAVENSRVQTSVDPANKRAGIIYVNSNAKMVIDKIWSANGGAEFSAAVALDTPALEAISDVLRHEASYLEGSEAKQVNALAAAFSEMVSHKYDGAGLINVDLAKSGHLDLARNHEMFHVWQYGQSQPNDVTRKPMDVEWASKINGYNKVRETLVEKGYPDDQEDIVREFAAYAATNDLERLGFSKQEAENVATDFLYEYFTQISKQYGPEHLERIGRVSIPARAVAERVSNENRSTQTAREATSESRRGEQATSSPSRIAVSGIRLSEGKEDRRSEGREERIASRTASKEKRSSFGSLENEPKGQVLASGFNVQNLFNRKPKEAKAERPIPLPKDFDAQTWARKTYTDAIVNAMSPADRAKYDAAKGEKAKIAAMLSAKVDQALKDSVFDLIDKAATAAKKGDGRGVLEAVRDAKEYASAPATNLEKLSAIRKASMLSRPTTHLRNLLGNTVFQPLEEAARIPGSIADSAMGLITGRRTLKGANPTEMWRSTTVAATEGVQKAKDAMRGLDPEDLEKAFQVKEIKFKNPIIDKAVKFSFRSLNAEDKIFYTYAYDRAIREQAKLTALNERKDGVIDRKDQRARAEYLQSNPTVEMDVDAMAAAEVAVFRNKNILSTGIQSARTAMGDKGSFAVDLILPFDKTPTNIIARTLEYTPLGGVIAAGKAAAFGGRTVKEYRAAKKEGTPSRQAIKEAIDKAMTPAQQRSFSLLAGRSVTGTAAPIALGYFLAAAGMATGAYDEDDRKENAKRRETNTPPSSIKIGGRWYQVGGLPPLGSLIAMGATLHEEVNKEDADMESIILGTAKGVGQIASDVPLLRSTKDAVEGLTKEGRAGQKVGRIASSFIPGVVSDAGQLTPGLRDPYERQTRSDKKVKGLAKFGRDVGGEVAGKIPGLRRLLPIKTDGSGRKIETEWPDPFDPFSSRPAMDSTEQPGIRGERSRAGLSNTELKQKTGEPDAVYKQRVDRVNGWMDTYGQKLIDNPRYKALPEDQQKAAIESLRRRIGAQQNAVRPNEKGFEPNAVLLGVQKSTREKPKRDARKLWVAPPR
jgi:hypothetical protein